MTASAYRAITNFTGGEITPLLRGRPDIASYRNSCDELTNMMPLPFGGAMRRPGTQYVASATTASRRLLPFVYSRTQSYVLELRDAEIRIHDAQGVAAPVSVGVAWGAGANLLEADCTQRDDTMLIFWRNNAGQSWGMLRRYPGPLWRWQTPALDPPPMAELGHVVGTTLTQNATSGTVTITAGAATFIAADRGRRLTRGAASIELTSITNSTTAVGQLPAGVSMTPLSDFASLPALLEGSPQAALTITGAITEGGEITLTASIAAWRLGTTGISDFFAFVRLNGGLVRLTGFASETVATGRVLIPLSSTTAVPAGAWTLEQDIFARFGSPGTGTFHQQRLFLAAWPGNPQGLVGSGLGLYFDFMRSDLESDGLQFDIGGRENDPIEYLLADDMLLAMGYSSETAIRGADDSAISRSNINIKRQSRHGCRRVRPIEVDRGYLFVRRDGRRVLSVQADGTGYGYMADDLSILAEHMTGRGVIDMAFARTPWPVVYCVLTDGTMACCTLDRAQNVVAWWRFKTSGTILSVCSVPRGDRDDLYLLVQRGASNNRYLERLRPDWYPNQADESAGNLDGMTGLQVDCAIITDSASAFQSVTNVTPLAGFILRVQADGYDAGLHNAGGGQFTLPNFVKRVAAGLDYFSKLSPVPMDLASQQGTGMSRPWRPGPVMLKIHASFGGTVDGDPIAIDGVPTTPVWTPQSYILAPPKPVTGEVVLTQFGWERDDPPVVIEQQQPYPLHVLAIVAKAANSG